MSDVPKEYLELFERLIEKIKSVNWTYKTGQSEETERQYVLFEVPKEREFETLRVWSSSRALPIIVKSNFQDYKFIKGFEAIWSPIHRRIECELDMEFPSFRVLELIERVTTSERVDVQETCEEDTTSERTTVKPLKKVFLASINDVNIVIGNCSEEFRILAALKSLNILSSDNSHRRITLQIENININTHAEAQKYLLKISNSLLFQLNQLLRFPTSLASERINRRTGLLERAKINVTNDTKFVALKHEYDNEPMALYIHAKKSVDSPLNQFLGYYQSIEYYFSVYANLEAKRQIQRILKNPLFNPNVDTNITQIISAIKVTRSNEIGDERNQLEITIRSCVDQDILKEFIVSDAKRKEYYEKNSGKLLSSQTVNITARTSNIIKEIADRIYDIRCRIVHKKANEGYDGLILPYSPEVKLLKVDTEIIEFIARTVLIENSRPINL